nr:immunoglobulin light chain junction region [Macaca mulatta]MPO07297.1 immunoglobulin light chain junction region [Macaca mulatta]MPO07746.1 immunoglobulin light chain junction region [Macaca mulatta]MPO08390.1 immunoglobulin light chain junction region [Macaca mulatta]MPO08473.1 immunoglobulin light chain junction region [Macaca mulatta]
CQVWDSSRKYIF